MRSTLSSGDVESQPLSSASREKVRAETQASHTADSAHWVSASGRWIGSERELPASLRCKGVQKGARHIAGVTKAHAVCMERAGALRLWSQPFRGNDDTLHSESLLGPCQCSLTGLQWSRRALTHQETARLWEAARFTHGSMETAQLLESIRLSLP